jgi:outer membrane lipoprotein SlyB
MTALKLEKPAPKRRRLSRAAVGAAFTASLALLGGCATQPNFNQSMYSSGLQQQQVQLGEVIAVRDVKGQGGAQTGQILGGVAGAIVGQSLGHGNALAGAAGALGGAMLGGTAQQKMGVQQVHLVTVRLASGGTIAVVEQANFWPGERVQVVYSQNPDGQQIARVFPLASTTGGAR